MVRRGDMYENRVTGEYAVVLRGDDDGDGESILAHLTVEPGGAVVGEHVHPVITERFAVIAGTLGVKLAGEERTLVAGQEAVAAPGVAHDWWNAGADAARVLVEVDPPEPRFAQMIGTLFGLANAGKTNSKGMPNPFQLALVGMEFDDVIRFTKPPRVVQKVALPVLGAIGRARGMKGIYPEYLAPHANVEPDPAALEVAGLDT